MPLRLRGALAALVILAGCAPAAQVPAPAPTPIATPAAPAGTAARWDSRPGRGAWTTALEATLNGSDGAPLLAPEPADVARFCPAWPRLSTAASPVCAL
jgi:hypothetical protein